MWNLSLENTTILQHALRGAVNLSLQARTCTQSDCSDNSAFVGSNGTGTYFTNMSKLNEVGLCVAEDSLITLANGSKKKIKDINEGEFVQSLDEKTGKIVSNRVNELLDMGNKTIYELKTEGGKAINTTAEHPYLVKVDNQSAAAKPSSLSAHVLPLISSENFSRNCVTNGSSLYHTGGCARRTTITGNFDGGNSEVFKKSLSRVNIALDSLHASSYSLEFLIA